MNKILLSFLSLILVISCSKNVSPVDSGLETQTFHFGNGSEPQGIDPHAPISKYSLIKYATHIKKRKRRMWMNWGRKSVTIT